MFFDTDFDDASLEALNQGFDSTQSTLTSFDDQSVNDISSLTDEIVMNDLPQYLTIKNENVPIIKDLVFGVPNQEFIYNSVFGINIQLNDYDKHFRFLKIKDVGWLKHSGDYVTEFIFKLVSKKKEFNNLLSNIAEFKIDDNWDEIKFALTNDSGYDLELSNEYGSSVTEKLNNLVGPQFSEARQFYNTTFGSIRSVANMVGSFLQDHLGSLGKNVGGTIKQISEHIMIGDKAALPRVWRSASMNNSFTCKTLLAALNEDKQSIYEKILVPLMILTILSTPIGTDSIWFQYPFLVKCEIEGFREFEAAYISNLRISFGNGDSFFSKDKKFIMIDVSFTIVDMYSVMITPGDDTFDKSIIPNTKKWFKYIKQFVS